MASIFTTRHMNQIAATLAGVRHAIEDDYELPRLLRPLAVALVRETQDLVVEAVADMLEQDNPRFQRALFVRQARGEEVVS